MKRFLACILTVALLLTALPLSVTASAASTQYGTVHGGWLRLRQSPNLSAKILTAYYTGATLTIHGYSNGWYQVTGPDGQQGYCYAYYVTLNGSVTPTPSGTAAWVTSANGLGVRMRTGPGTGYRVYSVYPVGTQVTILNSGTYWHHIQIGNATGYMMTQFLTTGTPYVPPTGSYTARVTSRNGYGVFLRTGPGKGYSAIGKYSVGTNVVVLNHGTTWDYIRVGTRTGYMMNEFLTITGVVNTITGVTLGDNSPVVGVALTVASTTPAGATVTYKWYTVKGSTVTDTGYTGASYSPSTADIGSQIRVTVTGTGYYTGSASATTTDAVVAGAPISSVALNNPNPVVGDLLKPVIVPSNAKVDCLWTVGTDTYTTDTYTVKATDVDKTISVKVVGKSGYTGEATSPTSAAVVGTGTLLGVTLSNTAPAENDTLTATLNPATASASYQWLDGSNNVLGSGATYVVTAKNATDGITIHVIATGQGNYAGSSVTSSATSPVTAAVALVGVTLKPATAYLYDTVEIDTINPSTATASNLTDYRWYINGVEVTAARGQTSFALDKATYEGQSVRLDVTGKNGYKGTVSGTIARVEKARALTGTPTITGLDASGNAQVNVTLTANAGTVPAAANPTYEWFVDGVSVGTGASYVTKVANYNKTLVLKATAGNGTGYAGTVSSADAPVSVPAALTGTPVISGTAQVGQTLTAGRGTLPTDLPDAKITYTWVRSTGSGAGTPFQTGATYTLAAVDHGCTIYIIACGTSDSGYVSSPSSTGAVSSNSTAAVAATALTGTPGYTPTAAVQGTQLTASLGTLPSDATVTYAWYKGTSTTPDATGATYTPADTTTLRLVATATSGTAYTGSREVSITVSATAVTTSVTLNANGGVLGATTSVTATNGSAMTTIASANMPTYSGHTLNGLYDAQTGGTKYYNADGTSAAAWDKTSATSTLYAQWTVSATTLTTPTGLSLQTSGAASWTAVSNASSYTVNLYKDGGATPVDTQTGLTAASCTFTMSTVGSYTFTVQAIGDGTTYLSSAISAQSAAATVTASPTALTKPSGLSWSNATASWTAVSNASSYSVQLYKGGTAEGSAVSVSASDTTTSLSCSEVGAAYTFTVTAVGDGTTYTNSPVSEASGSYTVLAAPASASWSGTSATWSQVTGCEGYYVILWDSSSTNVGHASINDDFTLSVDLSTMLSPLPSGNYTFTVYAAGDGTSTGKSATTTSNTYTKP